MINEGARLLADGIVPRPQEIDVIWVHGFGFPAYRGGPMYYADRIGLPALLGRLRYYADAVGAEYFAPGAAHRAAGSRGARLLRLRRASP